MAGASDVGGELGAGSRRLVENSLVGMKKTSLTVCHEFAWPEKINDSSVWLAQSS